MMMTRSNVVFYITAITVGCLFQAACYFPYFLASGAHPSNPVREFALVYFFTMVVGWIPQVLSAFLLRRLIARLDWRQWWQWVLVGIVISMLLFLGMAAVGNVIQNWSSAPNWLRTGLMFIFVGPVFLAKNPLWIPIPAAGATAAVLFLVQRRFSHSLVSSVAAAGGKG